jgi:TATA-binding protein-associated factor Taf7
MYFFPSTINLQSHQMQSHQMTNTVWIGVGLFVLFLLLFFFRDSISHWKEGLKKNIRYSLKKMFFKVEGDTINNVPEGPMKVLWEYLDTFFLSPSEAGLEGYYDYLPSDEESDAESIVIEEMQDGENDEDSEDDDSEDDDSEDDDSEDEDEQEAN